MSDAVGRNGKENLRAFGGAIRIMADEMESPMRRLARRLLWIPLLLAAPPVGAQTYDPAYPICIQTFGRAGNTIVCSFASMDQCRLSAWGGAAQCITNPYFAGAPDRASGRRHRR
jgi:hypothetical protein